MNKNIYLLILFTVFFSCKHNIDELDINISKEGFPDVSVNQLESDYIANKKLKAKILAPVANNYTQAADPYIEFPDGVEVLFYDDSIKMKSSLTANYAIYYQTQQLWKATGNVILKNENGSLLRTEELFGDESTEKIYSLVYVEVMDPDSTLIKGKNGFESNIQFTEYQFKNVEGVVYALTSDIEEKK